MQTAGSTYRLTTADFEAVLKLREEPAGPEVETEVPPAEAPPTPTFVEAAPTEPAPAEPAPVAAPKPD